MTRSTGKTRTSAGNLKLTMTPTLKIACRFARLLSIVTMLAVGLTACNPAKRLTKANVTEVTEGMSKKQVESILGPPTTVDTKDFVVVKKTVYVYDQGKESVTIVFKDDKVQSKVSTLSE